MTKAQGKIIEQLAKLVVKAGKNGLSFVADSEASAIRVMTKEEELSAPDLREAGEIVRVHNGCGGGSPGGGNPMSHGLP
jgi:hypothetical protein